MSRAIEIIEKIELSKKEENKELADKFTHATLKKFGGPTKKAGEVHKTYTDASKAVAKKAKDKAWSLKDKVPARPSTKSGPSSVSSIPHDPEAAKKAFHTAVGAAAVGGATLLAARRRKKRREREASYRGSHHYDDD